MVVVVVVVGGVRCCGGGVGCIVSSTEWLREEKVRRRDQNRQRGGDGEQCENYKAQTIDHHGGEFPVFCDFTVFVVFAQLPERVDEIEWMLSMSKIVTIIW